MKHKHNYQVVVGNVGTMDYTSKKLAIDCFKTYRTLSIQGITSAANEQVTLFKDGEIIDEYIPRVTNLIAGMFNINEVKKNIAACPKDEIVILCAHWSINCPKYADANAEQCDFDFSDFEEQLGVTLLVNDYDDLIADVHGIYSA